tara:strand:- start:1558 stop:1764 length:207 start_codon:yes stop_codon:yes gene_type:complete
LSKSFLSIRSQFPVSSNLPLISITVPHYEILINFNPLKTSFNPALTLIEIVSGYIYNELIVQLKKEKL